MIPTELVGTAQVPGGVELRCYRHDDNFRILAGTMELMSTRVHGSEEALAELAIDLRGAQACKRVLVGGLGMGFTLARTLALVDEDAVVEVAELVPEIVTWNRELLGHHTGHPLRDPRTQLIMGDVGEQLARSPDTYDVVTLDVDNGPIGLSRECNDDLYDRQGLQVARAALRPGGVLGIWSSDPNHEFERVLRGGFDVSHRRIRARRDKGPWRTIWLATAKERAS